MTERTDGGDAEPPLSEPTPQAAWVPPDTAPTRLILLRHGVTEHTLGRRFAGRSDLPLATQGRAQAEAAAGRIAGLGAVATVVSSPLQRARQTGQAVSDRLGLPSPTIVDDLVETDFGDWDGQTFAEVGQRWPAELEAWKDDPAMPPPHGEAFTSVAARVLAARDALRRNHPGVTLVAVSHVTPIKVLVADALQAPLTSLYRMFLDPASICVIDYYGDGPVSLRSFNDSAHLAGL